MNYLYFLAEEGKEDRAELGGLGGIMDLDGVEGVECPPDDAAAAPRAPAAIKPRPTPSRGTATLAIPRIVCSGLDDSEFCRSRIASIDRSLLDNRSDSSRLNPI